jgi:CheY-like chemotaxis protein
MTGSAPSGISELRHDLRTPVNHIVGYAEMLLEEALEPSAAGRRRALEETLGAAREVLGIIDQNLSASRTDVSPRELAGLYDSLREPQGRILRAMRDLLTSDGASDETFRQDVERIVKAAERLVVADASTRDDAPASAVATAAADGGAGAAEQARQAKILVVDDVEDNRELLRRRLERQGYVVGQAAGGREAIAAAAKGAWDLVLLDVMMPDVDGYVVREQLKSAPRTRDIPVIMISALDDMSSVVRCIERGAEDYLPKPFDPTLLRARVSACLEKKRLRDQEKEYLAQVQRVIEAARSVEAGEYRSSALADLAGRDDALGRLARVFDGMAQGIREREERLRDRVRDLRSEIEAARDTGRPNGPVVDGGNLQPGERFADRYEVQSVVGTGGMGSVYRARDCELDETVAIKTLRRELVADETLIERFKQEIRLARKISHRNVVRTHDFGTWSGVHYLTMEYVEGITVRDLIDSRGQLGVSASLAVGSQLAEALAVAHEQGVVHRDIKPQNLLLDADGVLKVMDFGVARLAEYNSMLTEAGLVVGTPAYMSPEQLLGEPVDGRSDLYAAGVVLFECLTGRLPLDAASPVSLIAKLLHEEPPAPVDVNADIPPALSGLIMQLLAKKPEQRLSSAAELAKRMRELE